MLSEAFGQVNEPARGRRSTRRPLRPQSVFLSALRALCVDRCFVKMSSHVDFVGVLFVIWGLLTALVGLSTLALGIGAVALITSASRGGGGGEVAAGVTAALFTTLAVIAIIWGAAHVWVGLSVRRRKPWGRLLALMFGSVDLLLLPYGTALGIYALWVLLNEEGKRLFEIAG